MIWATAGHLHHALREEALQGGTLRLWGKVGDLGKLAKQISKGEEIEESALRSGRRQRKISKVRRLLCQVAVEKLGYPAAKVAASLG